MPLTICKQNTYIFTYASPELVHTIVGRIYSLAPSKTLANVKRKETYGYVKEFIEARSTRTACALPSVPLVI
jgi:hypothetical protein